jgi:hypothetical protein
MYPHDLNNFLSAADMWMGIESLTPNDAPEPTEKPGKGQLVWELSDNQYFPWIDLAKQKQLKEVEKARPAKYPMTWRYVLYAGIIPMEPVVSELCSMLGTVLPPDSEFRPSKPAATVAILLDMDGYVASDKLFVSSMPWAIAQVRDTPSNKPLQFSGFSGKDGFSEKIVEGVNAIIERQHIVPPSEDEKASAAEPSHPVSLQDVEIILEHIFAESGWKPSQLVPGVRIEAKRVSIKSLGDGRDAELGALNSFYLEDLAKVSDAACADELGKATWAFVKAMPRSDRVDLRSDAGKALQRRMATPKAIPLGCWPSKYPLVYNQQFAVNNILEQFGASAGSGGIFSVNGPPGTGKTTLLRDVVAAIVVERALKLVEFVSPRDALGDEVDIDWDLQNAKCYRLHPSLCNQGIVVASANNGAVENVTKELPGIGAIPDNCVLRYFPELSDTLAMEEEADGQRKPKRALDSTWGAIAAVMGKSENRKTFFERFSRSPGKDKDKMRENMAAGGPVSLPMLMQLQKDETMSWEDARQRFRGALGRVQEHRERMEQISLVLNNQYDVQPRLLPLRKQLAVCTSKLEEARAVLRQLQDNEAAARSRHGSAQLAHERAKQWTATRQAVDDIAAQLKAAPYRTLKEDVNAAETEFDIAEADVTKTSFLLDTERLKKPSWLKRLFGGTSIGAWDQEVSRRQKEYNAACERRTSAKRQLSSLRIAEKKKQDLEASKKAADLAHLKAHQTYVDTGMACPPKLPSLSQAVEAAHRTWTMASAELAAGQRTATNAEQLFARLKRDLDDAEHKLASSNATLKRYQVDEKLANKWMHAGMGDEDIQKSAPWFDEKWFKARQDLFAAALDLQKAFVFHAWDKIRHTLLAVEKLANGSLRPDKVPGCPSALWDMFFMIVPVVSTTFASFPRMFAGWQAESIGWLLIDESGQATPQQALGPIWRSRRVVVVGDPRQLEPVVSLPAEVFNPLMKRCATRKEYHPATCSVQILADMANRIGTTIGDAKNGQWVGSPLRVHRRCLNPMFDIANDIAYNGMMVYGTATDGCDESLPESRWYDLKVSASEIDGNCVPVQIKLAENLARRFVNQYGIKDDKGKFRLYLITPFRKVNEALDDVLYKMYGTAKKGMHGTVHTFQGKEADAVIFVLGGNPDRKGAILGFAAAKPNLLNVAVTRAKQRIYVIGDYDLWKACPYFNVLAEELRVEPIDPKKFAAPRTSVARPRAVAQPAP